MRKSIFIRTFVTILVTMLAIQVVSWVVVSLFTEEIYYSNKLNQAAKVSDQIEEYLKEGNLDYDGFAYTLEDLSIQIGGRILLLDATNDAIYGSRNDGMDHYSIPTEALKMEAGTSQVYEFEENASSDNSQYFYCERLADGTLVVISISVKAISDTVNIIKMILSFVIVIAAVISMDSAYLLSKSVTSPLLRLNDIASEIGKLNFSVKYEEDRQDEIGSLGDTLNELSDQLQETVTSLQGELKKEKNLEAMRTQFIAQASHEMQTPIAVINSYIEAIEDGMVEDEAEKDRYFTIIREETDKMSKLVRGMLDISQIEAGTFNIKREYFDLYNLLERVVDKFHAIAEKRNVIFESDTLSDDEFPVYADDFRLEQVLTNFIFNAFKHTTQGKKTILRWQEKSNQMRIEVFNEGNGIREEEIPLIWGSFYKANTGASEKGIGLGLAIAKSILELHRYRFGVKNVPGGIVFWFEARKQKKVVNNNPFTWQSDIS